MNWFGKLYSLKNDILTDLKQGLYNYEKLREENPEKFSNGELFINLSLIPISQIISLLIYDHFVGHIPPSPPSEEIIIDIISRSKKTREEAIEYYMTHYKTGIVAYGYVACALFSPLIPLTLVAYEKDPGEKILKYSYALGKTVRNGFGRIKSYLKGMQQLKQKRKEMYQNRSKLRGCSETGYHKTLSECERLQNLNGALILGDRKKPLVLGSNPNNPIAHGGEYK